MIKTKLVLFGTKKLMYYKGLLIRADYGLHEQIAEIIREKLPNGGRILDLGCGQGALSLRLHDMGYQVHAVDIDPADFKCGDIVSFEQLDFNNESAVTAFIGRHRDSFDLVIGIEVIEHIENPWEYIRGLKCLTKKGGLILISTPNTTSWYSRLRFLFTGKFHQFREEDLSYGHISPITPYHLKLILEFEKLQDISIYSAGLLPPFWIQKSWNLLFLNMLNIFFYPFMKGIKNGWCIIATARKT